MMNNMASIPGWPADLYAEEEGDKMHQAKHC